MAPKALEVNVAEREERVAIISCLLAFFYENMHSF